VDEKMKISGRAAVFNSPTSITDSEGTFDELINPRAFDAVLKTNPDVIIVFNHNASMLLGRTASGTAQLATSPRGLLYLCTLPDTQLGNDIYALVSRGDIRGSSFSFVVARDEWEVRNGRLTRTIMEVGSLYDCSPVTTPAYDDTTVIAD
jgi:uncharacterized protein